MQNIWLENRKKQYRCGNLVAGFLCEQLKLASLAQLRHEIEYDYEYDYELEMEAEELYQFALEHHK